MIKVTPRFFIRDVLFYLFTCIYLLTIMLGVGYFNFWLAFGLLLIYFVYVITVVVQSNQKNSNEEEDIAEHDADEKAYKFEKMITSYKKENHKQVEIEDMDKFAGTVEKHFTKKKSLRAQTARLDVKGDFESTRNAAQSVRVVK